ncbi:MAG TPA: PilZ domain-containing protein [Nevskia sp.]|nr:PilZ domain-containing protein [Nevskia sp.]
MSSASTMMDQVISYRDRLPLRWTPLAALPEGLEAERLAESNLRVLSTVAMLAEHAPAKDDPTPAELEMQRMHLKLNLLLELVGGFLTLQSSRPQPLPLRLSWRGVAWSGAAAEAGAAGIVEIHVSATLPQPLRLPARIVSAGGDETVAEFAAMPEFCQTALERHVFLHHRREVAETRQPQKHG